MSTPAFRSRGITEGCLSWWPAGASFHEWLGEVLALVDWMGKMRLNRLFVHFNRLPPGDVSPLVPELERRGVELELVGHVLPRLLPADLRKREPEICRVPGGQRRSDTHLGSAPRSG